MSNAPRAGKVRVSVVDKTYERPLRTANAEIASRGRQRVAISIAGLRAGSYVVRVEAARQTPVCGHLMVR